MKADLHAHKTTIHTIMVILLKVELWYL